MLLIMASLLRFIPLSVLSALILSSIFSVTNWEEILSLMKAPRLEAAAWVVTALLTIVTDLPTVIALGMLIEAIPSRVIVPPKLMREFLQLLRLNRNYRYTWMGQVVSEIGDHFNNIAVFALAMEVTHSGLVVTGTCWPVPSPL